MEDTKTALAERVRALTGHDFDFDKRIRTTQQSIEILVDLLGFAAVDIIAIGKMIEATGREQAENPALTDNERESARLNLEVGAFLGEAAYLANTKLLAEGEA